MTRVLALDVGTSVTRALVFEEDGSPVGPAARSRHVGVNDPDELVAGADEVLRSIRRRELDVDAVAVSCFWHSVLALDASGRPLTPVLGWRDIRAAGHADALAARVDAAAVHRRTGCPIHPSYWPAKLAWLARTEPDVFARAARFVSFAEYLLERVTREARMSVSMASGTGLYDLERRDWDTELLDVLGVSRGRLPDVGDAAVADRGPWYPALGDGACSNVGVGALGRERATLTLGTSAAYRTVFEAPSAAPSPGLFLYRLDERRYVEGGSFSEGDNLYYWLKATLRLAEGDPLAGREPGAHGLVFLPLFGGERAPGWNAHARGAVAGLTFDTTPADVLHAALEGLAYRFAEVAEQMPAVEQVVTTGGVMSRNESWLQLLADVLERPVATSPVQEASARGAAVVALERLGASPTAPPVERVYEPRAAPSAIHREARERQRALYEAVS